MRHTVRLVIAAFVALAATALAAPTGASAATPTKVPWTDSSSKGYIGFCNAANQQIYTGSIDTYPFVAKAVASTSAPTGYGANVGRAVLYAYQPIQYVDPTSWSGKQMSGATAFTNSAAPMVAELPADPALINFSAAFPLHWEGLAQVRMYFTAVSAPPFSETYPSIGVQVSGTTWTQVGGGPVNCAGGQARSDEADLAIANNIQRQGGAPKASGNPVETAGATGSPSATASTAKGAAGDATASLSPVAENSKSGSGGSNTGLAIGIVIVVIGLAGGATLFLRRRRRLDESLFSSE